jgi:hypothetical protein
VSGTPIITHRACPDDWLAQFSLTHVHKGGLKQYSYSIYNKFAKLKRRHFVQIVKMANLVRRHHFSDLQYLITLIEIYLQACVNLVIFHRQNSALHDHLKDLGYTDEDVTPEMLQQTVYDKPYEPFSDDDGDRFMPPQKAGEHTFIFWAIKIMKIHVAFNCCFNEVVQDGDIYLIRKLKIKFVFILL